MIDKEVYYKQGQAAFVTGQSNPYAPKSVRGESFAEGYNTAFLLETLLIDEDGGYPPTLSEAEEAVQVDSCDCDDNDCDE